MRSADFGCRYVIASSVNVLQLTQAYEQHRNTVTSEAALVTAPCGDIGFNSLSAYPVLQHSRLLPPAGPQAPLAAAVRTTNPWLAGGAGVGRRRLPAGSAAQ